MKTILLTILFLSVAIQYSVFAQEKMKSEIQRDLFSNITMKINEREEIFNSDAVHSKKSVPLAVGLSLLIPGLGEWYADGFSNGKYFVMSETALWLTYASFDMYGSWVRDDARNYAKTNAGISLDGKDDKFFVNIGNYRSINEYNYAKLLIRQSEVMYLNTEQYFWEWKNDAQRRTYKEMRISSDVAFNNLKFVGSAIAVNHILSAINAGMAAVSYNRSLSTLQFDVRFNAITYQNRIDGMKMVIHSTF
ncbi:MAG: hypothetical protein AAB071_00510 [Bacteroidota bacterium]